MNNTEIIFFTKEKFLIILPMQVGEEMVDTKPADKYIGVMVDSKLCFWKQIRETVDM